MYHLVLHAAAAAADAAATTAVTSAAAAAVVSPAAAPVLVTPELAVLGIIPNPKLKPEHAGRRNKRCNSCWPLTSQMCQF